MITREMLSSFFDELEKIAVAGLIAPALLGKGAKLGVSPTALKLMGRLPSPASIVRPSALASKVRIAADVPARIIPARQPLMRIAA